MNTNYIVCYDIKDERRLARVYNYVRGRGKQLQYSVFLCRLDWADLLELKKKLKSIINEQEDDIRIYPLPGEIKVTVMGCGDRIPEGVEIFLA